MEVSIKIIIGKRRAAIVTIIHFTLQDMAFSFVKMKWMWIFMFLTFVTDALKIENVVFEEYAMFGATVTMVCEYQVGESEYVDSIKWYKDNQEFYRIVPHTSIEKDKVVTFNRSGINLDLQRSGVSFFCMCPFRFRT